jgi:hypothetical protein
MRVTTHRPPYDWSNNIKYNFDNTETSETFPPEFQQDKQFINNTQVFPMLTRYSIDEVMERGSEHPSSSHSPQPPQQKIVEENNSEFNPDSLISPLSPNSSDSPLNSSGNSKIQNGKRKEFETSYEEDLILEEKKRRRISSIKFRIRKKQKEEKIKNQQEQCISMGRNIAAHVAYYHQKFPDTLVQSLELPVIMESRTEFFEKTPKRTITKLISFEKDQEIQTYTTSIPVIFQQMIKETVVRENEAHQRISEMAARIKELELKNQQIELINQRIKFENDQMRENLFKNYTN